MRDFRDIQVGQKAHLLALAIYQVTMSFPSAEKFGLISQIRRAGVSIPANIAEGCGRTGDAQLAQFMQISMGSASELEYHLLLAHDLKFLPTPEYQRLQEQTLEVKRMLAAFLKQLRH